MARSEGLSNGRRAAAEYLDDDAVRSNHDRLHEISYRYTNRCGHISALKKKNRFVSVYFGGKKEKKECVIFFLKCLFLMGNEK